jgi:hypothetical protein
MRNTLKYLNDILALLTLPIYLLAPLAALAGRVFESLAPGLLPPWHGRLSPPRRSR